MTPRGWARALFAQNKGFPFSTNLSLISIPIGVLAIIIGQDISRGFTVVYNRPEVIYIWGAVLLLGGFNVASGIARRKAALERAGLYVLACAYAFYAVSVLLGLGVGGLVTAPVFLTLAISSVQRANLLGRAIREGKT